MWSPYSYKEKYLLIESVQRRAAKFVTHGKIFEEVWNDYVVCIKVVQLKRFLELQLAIRITTIRITVIRITAIRITLSASSYSLLTPGGANVTFGGTPSLGPPYVGSYVVTNMIPQYT